MFEGQFQSEIDVCCKCDLEFKVFYEWYQKLNKKCMDVELGVFLIDYFILGQMKCEKLLIKQKLEWMYDFFMY